MGIVQKDALRTTVISYLGLILGYTNKVVLFLLLLSLEEIGLINLIFALGTLFAQFSNLGTINLTWRFFPFLKNKETKHYGFLTLNLLIVLTGIFFFSTLLLLLGDIIMSYFSAKSQLFVDYYYWVIPVGIGIVLFKLLDNYLRALFKNVFQVFANEIIYRLSVTILLLIYWSGYLTFEQLFVALCLVQFIPAILLIIYLIRLGEFQFSPKNISIPKRFRKIILRYSAFSYVNTLGAVLVISLDSIMITAMLGLSYNGVYSTVIYMIAVLMVPYSSIMRVSAPLVSVHWKEREMEKMKKLYQQVSSVSLFIGLFCFMGVWVSREEIFSLLPEEFQPGVYIFLFLMMGRMLDMYFGLNGTILVTSKKYKYDVLFTGLLIVMVIVLNLYLIPIWGVIGAAISTCSAYFGYNILRMLFVWYHYRLHPFVLSQFLIMGVFTAEIVAFEFVPFDLGGVWLNMGVKTLLVVLAFPVLVYILRIEPETVNYVDKVRGVIMKKITHE